MLVVNRGNSRRMANRGNSRRMAAGRVRERKN